MAAEFGLTCVSAHRMDATKALLKPATAYQEEPGDAARAPPKNASELQRPTTHWTLIEFRTASACVTYRIILVVNHPEMIINCANSLRRASRGQRRHRAAATRQWR